MNSIPLHPLRCETCGNKIRILTPRWASETPLNLGYTCKITGDRCNNDFTQSVGCASHSNIKQNENVLKTDIPDSDKMMISFDAHMMIHKELTNIKDNISHIHDLLTPIQYSIETYNTIITNNACDSLLDKIMPLVNKKIILFHQEQFVKTETIQDIIESLRDQIGDNK